MQDERAETAGPDQELDLTKVLCPMTFVRTRLALDRMQPGQTLRLRLASADSVVNVPRTAVQQGHAVLSQETGADGVTVVVLQRDGLGRGGQGAA